MTNVIDQKEYLKKYLSGPSTDKKKKKKKVVKGKGLNIIDDDIDLNSLRAANDDLDLYDGEDAPQVAAVIDERPEDVQEMENFKASSKWKTIGDTSPKQTSHNSNNRQSDNHRGQSNNHRDREKSESPPPTNKKMAKTLEGKRAGLQNAAELRKENEAFKRREDEAFKKMSDDVSGRNATISRRGKRDDSEERKKLLEKAKRQKELDEKYKKWNSGVKQNQERESRIQDYLHEAAKPLARHKGDVDLEHSLKEIERDGDPMLEYMRGKKRERDGLPEKPTYKGNFPPNRFNIRPGYRWDGVDRSNGYEKKYFEHQSKKRAQQEDYYKWSSSDM